jgi:hypothetical protein
MPAAPGHASPLGYEIIRVSDKSLTAPVYVD